MIDIAAISAGIAVSPFALLVSGAGMFLNHDDDIINPGDPDVIEVQGFLLTEEFHQTCIMMPDFVFQLALSPVFETGEDEVAAEMAIDFVVEDYESERRFGLNLSEDGEAVLEDALGHCWLGQTPEAPVDSPVVVLQPTPTTQYLPAGS